MNKRERLEEDVERLKQWLKGLTDHVGIAKKQLDDAQEELADLDTKEAMLWSPEVGDVVFILSSGGSIIERTWCKTIHCQDLFISGNVYQTRDKARAATRWRIIDVRVRRAAEASGETKKHWWSITVSDGSGVEAWSRHDWHCGEPRFATEESCQACIDDIGKEDISFWLTSR